MLFDLSSEEGMEPFTALKCAVGYVREQVSFYIKIDEPAKIRLLIPLMCYYRQVVGNDEKFRSVWDELVKYTKEKGWTL